MEDHHQEKVQENVAEAAEDQEIQRIFGIAYRPQDAGTNVIDKDENNSAEIKSKIKQGICHQIFRCVHETQNDRGEHNSQNRDHEASHDGKGNGRVKSILKIFFIVRPVILGDDNRRTGRKANEEADDQVNDLAGRAAHAGQSLFSDKPAHHHGVRRVVKLLEKGSQKNGKEEIEKLLPDDTLRDLVHGFFCLFHDVRSP